MISIRRFILVCLYWAMCLSMVGWSSMAPVSSPARLDPTDPKTYFIAGEALAFGSDEQQDREIGAQVFAVGIGLAVRLDDLQVAASMCIALASAEQDPGMFESLWDYALMLDPDRMSAWKTHRGSRRRSMNAINQQAARCLYAARFQDPKLASELYNREEVHQAIIDAAQGAGVDPVKIDRLLLLMIRDADNDDCRGRVFITERVDGEVKRLVCPDHTRPIGASSSDESLRLLLKVETALLNGSKFQSKNSTWAVNTYMSLDSPSSDPSASMIAEYYGVDLAKPVLRADRWVAAR